MHKNLHPIHMHSQKQPSWYIPVSAKFWISHIISVLWVGFSIYVSLPWLRDLGDLVSFPVALLIITGIAYVPGYMSAFLVASLLLDRQPALKHEFPQDAITVLIAAFNEEERIFNTLRYLFDQLRYVVCLSEKLCF